MKSMSSKDREADRSVPMTLDAPELNHDTPYFNRLALENAEVAAALGIIVSAFVDLGFGASATHHALSAANRNDSFKSLADDFLRDAA